MPARNRKGSTATNMALPGDPNETRGFEFHPSIQVSPEVAKALSMGSPLAALESTIISHGMPYPENVQLAREVCVWGGWFCGCVGVGFFVGRCCGLVGGVLVDACVEEKT